MKTTLASTLRTAAMFATVFVASLFTGQASAASDAATDRLSTLGSIPVKAAGPYVEAGTLRIQVSTKLGRPSTVLPDGTWLYDNRAVQESNARGTLVVRFNQGRVSELALVTPAVAMAIRNNPHQPVGSYLVATK